ncbi:MAG: hypothetical protein ACQEQ1_10345 [Pseudomonadota bacterium]
MTMTSPVSAHTPPEPYRIAGHAALLLLCVAGLWLFMLQGRVLASGWVMMIWTAVTLVMLRGLFRRARIRRRAWRSAYLYPESPWNRRLRGGLCLFLIQLVKAGLLAAILLLTVVRIGEEPGVWRLMLAAVLLFVLARASADRVFWRDASPAYRPELVARAGQWSAGVVLVLCLLLWALVQPQPDFREATLEQVLWHVTDREKAVSVAVEKGTQWLAAWQGAEQWVAQQITALDQPHWVRAGVWGSVLVRQSLFVVSLLVLFNGVLAGRLRDGRR